MSKLVPRDARTLPVTEASGGVRSLSVVVVRRRGWLFLVLAAALLIGAFAVLRANSAFVATSRVLIEQQATDGASATWQPVADATTLHSLAQLAMSVPVAERAAAALRDSLPALMAIDSALVRLRDPLAMRSFVQSRLDVAPRLDRSALDIRFASSEPRVAIMVDRTIRDAVIAYLVQDRRDEQASAYCRTRIAHLTTRIDSLLAVRRSVAAGAGAGDDAGLVPQLRSELAQTSATISQHEMALHRLHETLVSQPDFVPSDITVGPLADARSRLDAEVVAYTKLLADHPESSRVALRQAGVVADLRVQVRGAVADYVQTRADELASLRARGRALQTQIADVQARGADAREAHERITQLDAQITARSDALEHLQVTSDDVHLAELAVARSQRVTCITDPQVATEPSAMQALAYAGLVAVLGLAVGVFASVVLDRGRRRARMVPVLDGAEECHVLKNGE